MDLVNSHQLTNIDRMGKNRVSSLDSTNYELDAVISDSKAIALLYQSVFEFCLVQLTLVVITKEFRLLCCIVRR